MSAAQSDRRPLLRHGDDHHSQLRPFTLAPFLEPGRDSTGTAAGGGQQHPIGVEHDNGAVIEDHTGLAQHDAVAGPSRRQTQEIVDIEAIGEFERVRTGKFDFSQ